MKMLMKVIIKKIKIEENFEVGESIELDLDSDQLNLFNEIFK